MLESKGASKEKDEREGERGGRVRRRSGEGTVHAQAQRPLPSFEWRQPLKHEPARRRELVRNVLGEERAGKRSDAPTWHCESRHWIASAPGMARQFSPPAPGQPPQEVRLDAVSMHSKPPERERGRWDEGRQLEDRASRGGRARRTTHPRRWGRQSRPSGRHR